jgi:FlaA1/EpsC-like NDP-sugar epimerase
VRAAATLFILRRRVPILIGIDSAAWLSALYFASGLRFETLSGSFELHTADAVDGVPVFGVLVVGAVAVACHLLLGWAFRLHMGRSALGSFEEMFLLGSVLFASGVLAASVNAFVSSPFLPRTAPVAASFIALVFCAWPRALWRTVVLRSSPRGFGPVATPALIVGAGDGARQLVKSMQRDPEQHWRPVGFVDDDRAKKHLRFRGLAVLGRIDDLAREAQHAGAATVIVAIPSADSALISRINDLAMDGGLDIKVLPGVNEVLAGVHHSAVRALAPEDLLGRHQIETDVESMAHYLTGKRVLVTGAGGSIGSELCRQLMRFSPAEIVKLDRDESALHSLLLSIYDRADLEASNVVLADIRDAVRMRQVFEQHRPEVVFHAAALKHVNMLEGHPAEAVKTNVLGTLNVLEAAAEFGVERFVNISTDKAADPVNVLGYTKRIAEGLTAAFASAPTGVFMSVRFGNVLGTRGSVLRTFESQIASGGPVTVTDPDVTRYFMTIGEAVQLVIQAAAIGKDGEALVLDMGEPVRIADVAKRLIEQSRRRIDIVYTGLKPGEKLHEVLFGDGELDNRPRHPMVSHVAVPTVAATQVSSLPLDEPRELVLRSIAKMSLNMTTTTQEFIGS